MGKSTVPQSTFLNESDKEFLEYLVAIGNEESTDLDMQEMDKKYPGLKRFLTRIKPIAVNLLDSILIDPDRTEKINQMNIRGEISDEQLIESTQAIIDGGVR